MRKDAVGSVVCMLLSQSTIPPAVHAEGDEAQHSLSGTRAAIRSKTVHLHPDGRVYEEVRNTASAFVVNTVVSHVAHHRQIDEGSTHEG